MHGPAEPAWRERLLSLRGALHDDIAALSDLRACAARRGAVDRLLDDLDRQLHRRTRAAVITLVGATGAGKSALLNALAGGPVAAEGIDRPTTRVPVIYAPRDAALTPLHDGLAATADGVSANTLLPQVVTYDPGGRWDAHVLIDAPDVNSVAPEHVAIVTALAERSDVLIVVLHRQSVVEQAPVAFLDVFARRRGLIFVLNRADELTAPARDTLLCQVRELAAARWGAGDAPVFCLSAPRAQLQPDSAAELLRAVADLASGSALNRVRRQNALGTAGLIQQQFADIEAEIGADLQGLPADVQRGSELLIARIGEELAARWELHRVDLTHWLWDEVGKRWDGPGGWMLRVGGTAAVGLGAGVMLAGRHPVLGTGTAAGSAAVEQMQRAAERRRLADATALVPLPGELAAWYGEALSPARVRAARLTGDVQALSVPAAEEAAVAVSTATAEMWQLLVQRDIPAAAARSGLRFAHLPLDVPVYALAAWVIYRIAIGFVTGQYLGVDFLLNAALLAAAYLGGVGLVIRRMLARRAGRLLRAAQMRCRSALAEWAMALRQRVTAAAAQRQQTLDRLTSLHTRWREELAALPPDDSEHSAPSGREPARPARTA